MNDDLGRALNDLADAAARAASRGIVSEPAVGPTLSRLTTAVRRRRASKTAGAGLLALALVAVTAGAVNAGLAHRAPGPAATSSAVCGASDDALGRLTSPAATVGLTETGIAPAVPTAGRVMTMRIDNLAAETIALLSARPRVVVVRDHVVVGGGVFDGGTRGPAQAGESTDFTMSNPLWACAGDGSAPDAATTQALPAGQYEVWVLADVTPVASATPQTIAGGPFALTLLDPSSGSPLDSADNVFRCGMPLPFDEATVPQPAGLWLAADIPTTWAAGDSTPPWTAVLTASDARTIDVTVAGPVELAFVGSDGLVKARTFTDAIGMQDVTATSGSPVTLQGNTWVSGCLPGGTIGGMITAAPLPAGTYTVWAFAPVTINHVTPDTGVTYEPGAIVVAVPPAVTVTVTG